MSTFKKCQVVMLPTNEKAIVGSIVTRPSDNRMATVNVLTINDPQPCVHQHLYFLSDEEIKEGDWILWEGKVVNAVNTSYWDAKKIIATTDKSLTIDIIPTGFKSGVGALSHKQTINLPQPSQSFIQKYVEEYNKGNIITEVMVEYEAMNTTIVNRTYNEFEPKINPRDNTITIRKIKDNWTREEVIKLINKISEEVDFESAAQETIDKWIKKNL